ncbi:hypothetical protein [Aquipuribacter hungaricus]|uniref:Asp23/Gls24 family envelope stress response protein n=1 Tax=Aquipuribacter hungaricus TaxID=545624 RepID=A0ABV7WLF7_9MICO
MSDPRTRPLYDMPAVDPSVPRRLPAAPGASPTGGETLARATQELRDLPEPGWVEVADRLRSRLRSVSRPGRPLTVGEDEAGRLQVDTRVVVDAVRRAVAALPGTRPTGVAVVADGTSARSVEVDVELVYGGDVRAAAETVRAATVDVLQDLLGVTLPVDVEVVDVVPLP